MYCQLTPIIFCNLHIVGATARSNVSTIMNAIKLCALILGITRHIVCEIACNLYPKALSPTNLQSAFKKAGEFPSDRNAVSETTLAPAEVLNFDTENAQLEVEINCNNIRCVSFEFPEAIVNDAETDILLVLWILTKQMPVLH